MEDINIKSGNSDSKRQLIRLNFHKQQHRDVLAILDRCTLSMKCDLVAEALRFYSKNYMRSLIDGGEISPAASPPAENEKPKQDSITDIFRRVEL